MDKTDKENIVKKHDKTKGKKETENNDQSDCEDKKEPNKHKRKGKKERDKSKKDSDTEEKAKGVETKAKKDRQSKSKVGDKSVNHQGNKLFCFYITNYCTMVMFV